MADKAETMDRVYCLCVSGKCFIVVFCCACCQPDAPPGSRGARRGDTAQSCRPRCHGCAVRMEWAGKRLGVVRVMEAGSTGAERGTCTWLLQISLMAESDLQGSLRRGLRAENWTVRTTVETAWSARYKALKACLCFQSSPRRAVGGTRTTEGSWCDVPESGAGE